MDRKVFTLNHYLGMSPTDWRLFPITGNAEITRIAELLAERHGVIADKIYGKTFSSIGKYLQFDEQRVIQWTNNGWTTFAFMGSQGFFVGDLQDMMAEPSFARGGYRVPVSNFHASGTMFSEQEIQMVKMARASRHADLDPSQQTLFI